MLRKKSIAEPDFPVGAFPQQPLGDGGDGQRCGVAYAVIAQRRLVQRQTVLSRFGKDPQAVQRKRFGGRVDFAPRLGSVILHQQDGFTCGKGKVCQNTAFRFFKGRRRGGMGQQVISLRAAEGKLERDVSGVGLGQIDSKEETAVLGKAERAAHVAVLLRQKRMGLDQFVPGHGLRQEAEICKLAVDARGTLSGKEQPAALREEVSQKRSGAVIERIAVRDENTGIAALANDQLAVRDASVLFHQPFIAIVMADAKRAKALDEGVERFDNGTDGCLIVLTVKSQISGVDGMDQQNIRLLAAVSQQIAQLGEIIVEGFQLVRPRIVFGVERGIVALALTADGVGIEMLAHEIDAVDVLPLGDALELLRRDIPADTGEGLGEYLLFAELLRDRGNLAWRQLCVNWPAEPVDSRNVLILIERHDARTAPHLREKLVFLNGVAGHAAVVCVAPAVDSAHEVFGVEHVHQPPVAEAEAGSLITVHEQRAEQRKHILTAIGFRELRQKHGRVGGLIAEILRLVGEEAGNAASEFRAEAGKIFLVCQLKKCVGNARIENIHSRRILAVIDAEIFRNAVLRTKQPPQMAAFQRVNAER